MHAKITILGLVAVLSVGSTGCRTASKLAWWKTADNAATDSTMMAHTAPALPSDIAQQAAGLAATQPGGKHGGLAAPFVPQVSITPTPQVAAATPPAAYPSASASTAHTTPYSPYSPAQTPPVPAATQQVAATTPGTTSNPAATNPVAMSLPYNPDAMPANIGGPPTAPPAPSQGRYASTGTTGPLAGPQGNPPTAAVAVASGTSPASYGRYGQPAAVSAANPPATQQTEAAPTRVAAEPATHFAGSRYQNYLPQPQTPPAEVAQNRPATPTATEPAPTMQSSGPTVALQSKPAAAMASTTPYRPGGTGTYPGQTAVEVATRPDVAHESSPMAVPRYGMPTQSQPIQSQPIQSQPTQGPRYR